MKNTNYSKAFNTAFQHLINLEGGYVNDAEDRGGETKYGISKRAHPDVDIANLTLNQAKVIYWEQYWLGNNHCDQLPAPLAIALFDGTVNHRARVARRLMQVALGVNADGIFGPKTIDAAFRADGQKIIIRYLAGRAQLYHQIVVSNSSQSRFAVGWFRRLFKLQQFILQTYWPWTP